jgi:2-oxoglutarate ferredoxin oxidoreductase subunit gamma
MKLEISLSGTGGQGMILAGIILAEAAILDGKNTVQTQSYGPEARGGASKAEVIISDEAIHYPEVISADILLAMSQDACNKYVSHLKPGGKLLVDTSTVKTLPEVEADVVTAEITRTARQELGNAMFANIVALGALVSATGAVSTDSLTKAVLNRVPPGTEALNQKALEIGFSMGAANKASA